MRRASWLVFGLGLGLGPVACTATSGDEVTSTGALSYETPEAWTHTESTSRESTTTVWTPRDNVAKESITVVRTLVHLRADDFTDAGIERRLVDAQQTLREARVTDPKRVTSASGLHGVQLEVDFVPPSSTQRYHRVHAVFLDGAALVHVMYTARTPDASLSTFQRVTRSLHHEES